MNYKLNCCIPTLEANDLNETIQFYTKKLGFRLINVYPDAEHPRWASVKRDNVEVIFTSPRNQHHPSHQHTSFSGSLYFYPTNLQAVWTELKDNVPIEHPIEVTEYGTREFAIRDCNGYIIHFGKAID